MTICAEDYVNIDTSNHGDGNENDDASGSAEKPSRAQRKRLRKKMLKEEAARRKQMIGPLLPTEMCQTPHGRVADAGGGPSNVEEASDGEEEAGCLQPVRSNVQEKQGTIWLLTFDNSTLSLAFNFGIVLTFIKSIY